MAYDQTLKDSMPSSSQGVAHPTSMSFREDVPPFSGPLKALINLSIWSRNKEDMHSQSYSSLLDGKNFKQTFEKPPCMNNEHLTLVKI
jgi:hypothetical protein